MSIGYPFSLLNDEQMSNKVGVEHQPVIFGVNICLEPFDDPCFGWKFGIVLRGEYLRKYEPVIWALGNSYLICSEDVFLF